MAHETPATRRVPGSASPSSCPLLYLLGPSKYSALAHEHTPHHNSGFVTRTEPAWQPLCRPPFLCAAPLFGWRCLFRTKVHGKSAQSRHFHFSPPCSNQRKLSAPRARRQPQPIPPPASAPLPPLPLPPPRPPPRSAAALFPADIARDGDRATLSEPAPSPAFLRWPRRFSPPALSTGCYRCRHRRRRRRRRRARSSPVNPQPTTIGLLLLLAGHVPLPPPPSFPSTPARLAEGSRRAPGRSATEDKKATATATAKTKTKTKMKMKKIWGSCRRRRGQRG